MAHSFCQARSSPTRFSQLSGRRSPGNPPTTGCSKNLTKSNEQLKREILERQGNKDATARRLHQYDGQGPCTSQAAGAGRSDFGTVPSKCVEMLRSLTSASA